MYKSLWFCALETWNLQMWLEYSFLPFKLSKGKWDLGILSQNPLISRLCSPQKGRDLGLWQRSRNLHEENGMRSQCLPRSTLQAPKDYLLAGRENNLYSSTPWILVWAKALFYEKKSSDLATKFLALAGVAQWIECQPANQRVTSSVPSQGTCLGCALRPGWARTRGNWLMFLSLCFSLPSPFSKK